MKSLFTFLILCFCIFDSRAQIFNEKIADLLIVPMAEKSGKGTSLKVDKSDLLETLNFHYSTSGNQFNQLELKSVDEKGKAYYYLQFSAKGQNRNGILQLEEKNGVYFAKPSFYEEDSTQKEYVKLMICEGDENCYPRVFEVDKKGWIVFGCREVLSCVDDETAKKFPCLVTNALLFNED